VCSRRQRGLDIGLQLEVDEVPNGEGALRPTLVSLVLHSLLSSKKVLPNRFQHSSTFSSKSFDFRGRADNRFRDTEMAWGVAIQYLEWRAVDG
jgi:hypothetical protein